MYMFRMQISDLSMYIIMYISTTNVYVVCIFKDFLYEEKNTENQYPVLHNMRYVKDFHGNLHNIIFFCSKN